MPAPKKTTKKVATKKKPWLKRDPYIKKKRGKIDIDGYIKRFRIKGKDLEGVDVVRFTPKEIGKIRALHAKYYDQVTFIEENEMPNDSICIFKGMECSYSEVIRPSQDPRFETVAEHEYSN